MHISHSGFSVNALPLHTSLGFLILGCSLYKILSTIRNPWHSCRVLQNDDKGLAEIPFELPTSVTLHNLALVLDCLN